ncbi:flagellar basal-body MS-ring/collar protein FliF [uncultured Erythrobacter sp.]|uniref:flagellar basal-body MS-ring/collar protein FliF n=1 Tax=uncultured Erythrobacter sp. TaxID=263913 RepID=UPI002636F5EA|nr:flagellar basal-body MS-ring/collar protein FliF [uncultured Erythrobacter sp.]
MAETSVPVPQPSAVPIGGPAYGSGPGDGWQARLNAFTNQPAFKRALPGLIGLAAVASVAAVYLMIATPPQRILSSTLNDAERAAAVQALQSDGIAYTVDTSTGILTVAESDFYRARGVLATNAGIASSEGANAMLDSIPLGSSRTMEGERVRLARERELMLTIREIDGVESVRVHLATPERSVFVRENNPPTASVMLRLGRGGSLSKSQVEAIINLVAGSVPGMTPDMVRVVDQNGRLLSAPREDTLDGLLLQREFEAKLQEQVASLLTPLLGEGNFSSQVQAELVREEVTSARETYDQEGSVRSESERNSSRMAAAGPGGIPGAATNTPPPDPELVEGPPNPREDAQLAQQVPRDTESAVQRNYELGREVAVTSSRPGGLVKLSVAIAVSQEAIEAAAPMTPEQLQSLVSAAVGADEARGDQVQVVVGAFDNTEVPPLAFYEQGWFAQVLRIVAGLIAVLLVLLLAVRPLIKAVKGPSDAKNKNGKNGEKAKLEDESDIETPEYGHADAYGEGNDGGSREGDQEGHIGAIEGEGVEVTSNTRSSSRDTLNKRITSARQLALTEPERAVEVLQRMIDEPEGLSEEAGVES